MERARIVQMTERANPGYPARRAEPALIVVGLVAVIAATLLGVAVRGENVLGWDLDITTRLQRAEGAFFQGLADVANVLGSTWFAAAIIGIAIAFAAFRRSWTTFLFLTSLLVLRLLATQIKPLFDSPRPTDDLVTIIGTWEGTGYPSGHALTSSTMALGLAVLAWRRIPARPAAIACIALLLAAMVTVGWARIWTGAHWTSDVIGGYLYGIAIVAASLLVVERMRPSLSRTESTGGIHERDVPTRQL